MIFKLRKNLSSSIQAQLYHISNCKDNECETSPRLSNLLVEPNNYCDLQIKRFFQPQINITQRTNLDKKN